jgi:hypothetical protein
MLKLKISYLASLFQQGMFAMRSDELNWLFIRRADEFLKLNRSIVFRSHVLPRHSFIKTSIFLFCYVVVVSVQTSPVNINVAMTGVGAVSSPTFGQLLGNTSSQNGESLNDVK